MDNDNVYRIDDLIKVDIDSWVEAMAWLDDNHHEEAANRVGEFDCASDLGEQVLTEISNERGCLFNRLGEFVRCEK